DGDARAFVLALRSHLLDAFETGDAIFDDLRDLRFDDCGRRAAINRIDAHDRRLNVRHLADRQPRCGHETDDREQEAHDHCKNWPADGDVGKNHVGTSGERVSAISAWRTGRPSRTSSVPSTTI